MKLLKSLSISILALFCVIGVASAVTVQSGDTMWKIARNANLSLTQLIGLNPQIENPNLIRVGEEINTEPIYNTELPFFKKLALGEDGELLLGSTKFVQVQDLYLAGSGISSSATSITLTKFQYPNGDLVTMNDFGEVGYAVIEPDAVREENISFTGITQLGTGKATLTGVTRGLGLSYPYTASSTLQYAHAGGTILRISNTAPFYNELVAKKNTNTFTDIQTFASSTDSTTQRIQFGTSTMSYFENNAGVLYYCNNSASCAAIGGGANTYSFQYPLYTSGSQVKFNTSTYDFTFRNTNQFAMSTSTVTSGTASGTALDDLFNTRYNSTTTKSSIFTFSDGFQTNASSTFNSTVKFNGNATSSATMDVAQLCFSGANCASSINVNYQNTRAATTTLSGINGPATEISVATTTISAGALGTTGGFKTSIRGYYTTDGSSSGKMNLKIIAGSATTAIGGTTVNQFNWGSASTDIIDECEIWTAGKTDVLMVNCKSTNLAANTSTNTVTTYSIDTTASIQAVWVYVVPAAGSSFRVDKGYAEIFKP